MQILPGTFGDVADKGWSIDNPEHNARAGIRYLKQLDKLSGGDPALTAAGYYGGSGGLEKARRGIAVNDPRNPNAPNTLEYGQQVVARMGDGGVGGRQLASRTPPAAASPTSLPLAAPEVVAAAFPGGPAPTPAAPAPVEPVEVAANVPAPRIPAQADPWQEFLRTMPQNRQPVNVADLDFSAPRPTMQPQLQAPQAMANLRPNFEAFASWKGRA